VNCRDRFHDVTTNELAALGERRPETTTFLNTGSWAACETWNVGAVPASFHTLVESKIPTLVLAGTYDPQTPPSDSRTVAEHLGNATFVELDATSHVAYGANPCADNLVSSFFASPNEPPDTSCAAELPSVSFTR